jgi:pyruvate/2-oxoglutarate dehydrogenase complex dihydrolipoamide acyltransferase (E2) component
VIDDKVMVIDRKPVVRTCLTFGISVDHYVVDGRDVIQAAASLKDKVTSLEYLKSKLDQP